jgi:hypothetical protein
MKTLINSVLLSLMLFVLSTEQGIAQADTINLNSNKLLTRQLKPGLKQYLVYFQQTKQSRALLLSLWTRKVLSTSLNSERYFVIRQHWYSNDTAGYRNIYSRNRVKDFSPVYHSETIGQKTKAYNWYPDHVAGADTVLNNQQKAFSLQLDQPYLNWNLDIETFEMLPLAAGKVFVLPLYDAGLGTPKFVTYTVSGSEMLNTIADQKVDCWKLLLAGEHQGTKYTQTFWISKTDHEFLMEEDVFNGMYRYKVKLPAYSPDLMTRFDRP